MSYLVSENMVAGYGGANILNSCSIQVDLGQIAVVVGPNGAGKSTAMKAIFGMLPLQSGSVKVLNERINDLPPFQRVKKGMAFVPQTDNIFTSLTVEENLEMGAFTNPGAMVTIIEQVYSLFPVLKEKRLQRAGELSGGQRQQVAVGRALMTDGVPLDLVVRDGATAILRRSLPLDQNLGVGNGLRIDKVGCRRCLKRGLNRGRIGGSIRSDTKGIDCRDADVVRNSQGDGRHRHVLQPNDGNGRVDVCLHTVAIDGHGQ